MNQTFTTKDLKSKVVDLDEKNFRVKIRVSAFGNVDSDGDVIVPGAFKKTIVERGPKGANRIKHLLQHDIWQPVGMPEELEEVEQGLDVVSLVSNSTRGKDAIHDYKIGLYEHSIGFRTIDEAFDEQKGANVIKELSLWEYSSVTWGANEKTPLHEIMKSNDPAARQKAIDRLFGRIDRLSVALAKGEHTEERLRDYEIELHQIKSFIQTIVAASPSPSSIDTKAEEDQAKDLIESFFKPFQS